jgi:phytanoyl-CoA hydroxylase
MKTDLTPHDIARYRQDGFLVIEDFLSPVELEAWRIALEQAVAKRNGNKMPDRKEVYGKGDDADKSYYDNVFDQLLNLWQDNEKMKAIMLDDRIGKMAAQLADVDGIRIWHDQAPPMKMGACSSYQARIIAPPLITPASVRIWEPSLPPIRNSKIPVR